MNCPRHIREKAEGIEKAKEREELEDIMALLAGRTDDCCTD